MVVPKKEKEERTTRRRGRSGSEPREEDPTPTQGTSKNARPAKINKRRPEMEQRQQQHEDDSGTEVDYESQPTKGGKKRTKNKGNQDADTPFLEFADLVSRVINHVFVMNQRRLPIKVSDIINKSMNGQSTDYPQVIEKVARTFSVVFGYTLYPIKYQQDPGAWVAQEDFTTGSGVALSHSHLMLISQFSRDVAVYPVMKGQIRRMNAIRVILNTLYLLGRGVDEGYIWKILKFANADKVCKKEEDLRRFLKTELADQLYLYRTENKDAEEVTYRYSWGIRAELESDKFEILKHAANVMKKPVLELSKYCRDLKNDPRYAEKLEKYGERRTTQQRDQSTPSQRRHKDTSASRLAQEITPPMQKSKSSRSREDRNS